MKTFQIYIKSLRSPFLIVSILPVIFGARVAYRLHGVFSFSYFVISICAMIFMHAGINVLNDYFDFKSGCDNINKAPLSPFAGGSQLIQKNLISAKATFIYGILLLCISLSIGAVLVVLKGLPILIIGSIGLVSGVCYSCPPFSLNYRGFGEMVVALNFGMLAVLGSFYLQTNVISTEVILYSLPVAMLAMAIVLINEFPDYNSDKQGGKRTIVVILGKKTAVYLFWVVMLLTFLFLFLFPLNKMYLFFLLLIPLTIYASTQLFKFYKEDALKLIPAIKSTIMLHHLFIIMLSIVF